MKILIWSVVGFFLSIVSVVVSTNNTSIIVPYKLGAWISIVGFLLALVFAIMIKILLMYSFTEMENQL